MLYLNIQNEQEIARELKEILYQACQKSIKCDTLSQGYDKFGPQVKQQPWYVIYHFKPSGLNNMNVVKTWKWNFLIISNMDST